jgi:hypothetical protein
MGAFNIKSPQSCVRGSCRSGLRALVVVLALLGVCGISTAEPAVETPLAAPAAEPPAAESPPSPTSLTDAAVSTSPMARDVLPQETETAPHASANLGIRRDGVPLTRAAAQRRVDTMSPMDWLSAYGPVRIAHPR